MANTSVMWKNPRANLVIEHTGGKKLGNCYGVSYYRVTSTFRLSAKALAGLFEAGVLGFGQESRVKSQHDGKEAPAGTDLVPCVEIDNLTNEVVSVSPMNTYTGKPYEPSNMPYFVYECECFCDSGD